MLKVSPLKRALSQSSYGSRTIQKQLSVSVNPYALGIM